VLSVDFSLVLFLVFVVCWGGVVVGCVGC
jgi:hypothetical protein